MKAQLLRARAMCNRPALKSAAKVAAATTVAGLAVTSGTAHAAVDTTEVLASIAAAVLSIGIVGTAVLGVKVAVRAFAWVAGAIR
ncbi:major capsid protein [Sphingomonas sp. NCPPB 2930]